MADFTAITTQEEFDARIKDRLEQKERSVKEQFADYETLKTKVGEYEGQISTLQEAQNTANTELADLRAKVSKYESDSAKTRIALEHGIPYELANKISGDTEEKMKADAQKLAGFLKKDSVQVAPLANPEPNEEGNTEKAAYKRLSAELFGED